MDSQDSPIPKAPLPVKITEPAIIMPLAEQPTPGQPSSTPLPAADTPTTQEGTLTDLNLPPKAASNIPYLITVAVMFAVGALLVGLLAWVRPETDLLVIFGAVFGFVTPTTAAILAFQKSQETHLSVNSRLDGFIKNAQTAALAQGNIEGRDAANARNDLIK